MDRSVLESDPHRVLEGMAIAAYAVGASQGFIYVRGEYPLAVSRLQKAIKQAKQLGLLGSGIFESPFDFRVDIRIGAGAFVCGEETALMASIEGKRGMPRPRPPYPAEKGLWGCPTLINNVETFANVAGHHPQGGRLVRRHRHGEEQGDQGLRADRQGAQHRPDRGADGHDRCGTSSRRWAAACPTAARSRRCRPAARPAAASRPSTSTRRSITSRWSKLGSIMGSGGMIVMDQDTNMVDVARFFMEFCMDESCGKCIPCRAGTVQMHQLLTRIAAAAGDAGRPRAARGSSATWCATPACAAWARRRRTRCSARCATSGSEYEALLQPDAGDGNGRAATLPLT